MADTMIGMSKANAIKLVRVNGLTTMNPITLSDKNWFAEIQEICGGCIQLGPSHKGFRKRGSQASLDLWVNEDGISMEMTKTLVVDQGAIGMGLTPLYGPIVLMAAKKPYGSPRPFNQSELDSIRLVGDLDYSAPVLHFGL